MEFPEIDDHIAAVRVNMSFRKTSPKVVIEGDSIRLPDLGDAKWEAFTHHRWYTTNDERHTVTSLHTNRKPTVVDTNRIGEDVKCVYTEYVTTTVDIFLRPPRYFQKSFNRLPNGVVGLDALYKTHNPYGYRLLQNHLNDVYYMGMTTWGGCQERVVVTPTQDRNYDRVNYNASYIRVN